MKYYLGSDVGGTNISSAVADQDGNIISRVTIPAGAEREIGEITKDIATSAMNAAEQVGMSVDSFPYWGIGMPSCINPRTRLLVHANCFRWRNADVFGYLKKYIKIPIYIENDANCAVLGEQQAGAAKGCDNVLLLTIGTGFGSGIVIDGKIFAGADGMGAELGHTKLVYDGVQCTCGQYGCAESYCSATALIRQMREKTGDYVSDITARGIMDKAENGDTVALEVVDKYTDYLACGMSTFITILRPELIILGGGVSQSGEFFYDMIRKKLPGRTFSGMEIGVPEIRRAMLGNDAGIIGAAFLGEHKGRHLIPG